MVYLELGRLPLLCTFLWSVLSRGRFFPLCTLKWWNYSLERNDYSLCRKTTHEDRARDSVFVIHKNYPSCFYYFCAYNFLISFKILNENDNFILQLNYRSFWKLLYIFLMRQNIVMTYVRIESTKTQQKYEFCFLTFLVSFW